MNVEKRRQIRKLIKEGLGHHVLQRMLAELVYETQHLNGSELQKRFDAVLEAIIGTSQPPKTHVGTKDDSLLLEAAVANRMSGPAQLTLGESTAAIARREILGGKLNAAIPKDLDPNTEAEIGAVKKRLDRKLAKNEDQYAKQYFARQISDELRVDYAHEEVAYIKTLIADWWATYIDETFQPQSS